MPSPFPGMDPYLEHPAIWPGFHSKLINETQTILTSALAPSYSIDVEERIYILDREDDDRICRQWRVPDLVISREPVLAGNSRSKPDSFGEPILVRERMRVPVRELYLVISESKNRQVIAVLEVLSPANKVVGTAGRRAYLKKRKNVMQSKTSLLEIDLLRAGRSMIDRGDYQYHALLSEHCNREASLVWTARLDQPLPRIPLPLVRGDQTVFDLQAAVAIAYDRGGYRMKLDYSKSAVPPLPKEWRGWANEIVETLS